MKDWYLAGYERRPVSAAAAAAAETTTWNPSDKNASIALSNSNLTATTAVGADQMVRAVASASSGKKYWELHADTVANVATAAEGIANSTASLSTYLGASLDSLGWAGDGKVYINGGVLTTIQTWAQNNTLCFALDIDALKIWFRTNGGNWNNDVIGNQNPATGTGGISLATMNAGPYFSGAHLSSGGDGFTANFGGSAYAQTAPSGFGNW